MPYGFCTSLVSGVSSNFCHEFMHGTVCLSQDLSIIQYLVDPVGLYITEAFIFDFLVMLSLVRPRTEFIGSLVCL